MNTQNRINKKKIQNTYENFPLWSSFYLTNLMPHLSAIYHFCRTVDDIGDYKKNIAKNKLEHIKKSIDSCFEKRCKSDDPFYPLMKTINMYNLSRENFNSLIEANNIDLNFQKHKTYQELLKYCHLSANPVGEMVLKIFGYTSKKHIYLSNQICTGLQIANFLQDTKRDSLLGRIYIPQEDLKLFNVKEDDILNQKSSTQFRDLIKFQSIRCWELFNNGVPLINLLNGHEKIPISLFINSGKEVLKKIHDINYDTITKRPTISKASKTILTLRAFSRYILRLDLVKRADYFE